MDCRRQRPFRFKQMWMNEKGCGDTVEVVWKENNEESWDLKILEKKKMIHVERSCQSGANKILGMFAKS